MMLSLDLARELRAAGLEWRPATHDFFALPERGMDEQRFVLADVLAFIQPIRGRPAVTFHGAEEWALDHIWQGEVLWIPTEGQLRAELAARLEGSQRPALVLTESDEGYRCDVRWRGEWLAFEGADAPEAYARALLHLLRAG